MAQAVADKPVTKPKKYRFRLLVGQHVDGEGPGGTERKFQAVKGTDKRKPVQPIIETDSDLGKLFNQPGSVKFLNLAGEESVADPTVRQPGEALAVYLGRLKALTDAAEAEAKKVRDELEALDLEGLLEFAAGNEIDVAEGVDEAEARRIIYQHLDG